MDKVIKEYNNFEDAELDDIAYYGNLDPNEKIKELEQIRNAYFDKIGLKLEDRKVKKVFEIADLK